MLNHSLTRCGEGLSAPSDQRPGGNRWKLGCPGVLKLRGRQAELTVPTAKPVPGMEAEEYIHRELRVASGLSQPESPFGKLRVGVAFPLPPRQGS